jgi:adenosylhomocysteine nucleosidase
MIGITFALPSESSDLRRRISVKHSDHNLLLGKIENREVALIHTGVGAKNCNERLEILLHKTRPRIVVSSGFAGAINNQLRVGDLILAENFSDSQLLASASRTLRDYPPQAVRLFTSTAIIDLVAQRNEIARASRAAAVDMETGAIANVCQAHGVPLISLRIISDTPNQPFPAPPPVLFDVERQRTNYSGLVAYLLRHPASIGGLIRFSQQIARGREILADAIVALVRGL